MSEISAFGRMASQRLAGTYDETRYLGGSGWIIRHPLSQDD